MKVSEDFVLREIAGEHILVPIRGAAARFSGMIAMNEIGAFIFRALQQETTEQELLEKIRSEYEVDEQTARTDLAEYLNQLREIGALEAHA